MAEMVKSPVQKQINGYILYYETALVCTRFLIAEYQLKTDTAPNGGSFSFLYTLNQFLFETKFFLIGDGNNFLMKLIDSKFRR